MGREAMSKTMNVLTVINRRDGLAYDIYAGRPSILGNPFPITANITRDEVVDQYEDYAWARMQHDEVFRKVLLACEGRRVACWCWPKNCHVNAIARLIVRWKALKQ
jgi:hypothetical protein